MICFKDLTPQRNGAEMTAVCQQKKETLDFMQKKCSEKKSPEHFMSIMILIYSK
jgi:hypothetical protein